MTVAPARAWRIPGPCGAQRSSPISTPMRSSLSSLHEKSRSVPKGTFSTSPSPYASSTSMTLPFSGQKYLDSQKSPLSEMYDFGIKPSSMPLFMAAIQLYSLPYTLQGRPMKTRASMLMDASSTSSSASMVSSSSLVCVNRSPQVQPVRESSGKTISFAPANAASSMASMILAALNAGSATTSSGVTAATCTNPKFICLPPFIIR